MYSPCRTKKPPWASSQPHTAIREGGGGGGRKGKRVYDRERGKRMGKKGQREGKKEERERL